MALSETISSCAPTHRPTERASERWKNIFVHEIVIETLEHMWERAIIFTLSTPPSDKTAKAHTQDQQLVALAAHSSDFCAPQNGRARNQKTVQIYIFLLIWSRGVLRARRERRPMSFSVLKAEKETFARPPAKVSPVERDHSSSWGFLQICDAAAETWEVSMRKIHLSRATSLPLMIFMWTTIVG